VSATRITAVRCPRPRVLAVTVERPPPPESGPPVSTWQVTVALGAP
jgi:hypothetical protein